MYRTLELSSFSTTTRGWRCCERWRSTRGRSTSPPGGATLTARATNMFINGRLTTCSGRRGSCPWIVQSAKDTACEALKQCKLKNGPEEEGAFVDQVSVAGREGLFRFGDGEHLIGRWAASRSDHRPAVLSREVRGLDGEDVHPEIRQGHQNVFYLGVVVEKKAAPPQMKGDVRGSIVG